MTRRSPTRTTSSSSRRCARWARTTSWSSSRALRTASSTASRRSSRPRPTTRGSARSPLFRRIRRAGVSRFGPTSTTRKSNFEEERQMSELVADYFLKRLREWGVHRIYGYPGDGINAFLGALDRADGDPDFIQARHEEMAAFMACGHAKFAGPDTIGVCMATSGPGAVHLLNGLYDAKLDHVPVLAVIGQQKRASLGSHYQQEIDLQTLFTDVSEYVQMCTEPAQMRHLIDRGIRIALDRKTVCA